MSQSRRAGQPSAWRAFAEAIFVVAILSAKSSSKALAIFSGGACFDDAPVRQAVAQELGEAPGPREADVVGQPQGLLLESQ